MWCRITMRITDFFLKTHYNLTFQCNIFFWKQPKEFLFQIVEIDMEPINDQYKHHAKALELKRSELSISSPKIQLIVYFYILLCCCLFFSCFFLFLLLFLIIKGLNAYLSITFALYCCSQCFIFTWQSFHYFRNYRKLMREELCLYDFKSSFTKEELKERSMECLFEDTVSSIINTETFRYILEQKFLRKELNLIVFYYSLMICFIYLLF